MAFRDQLPDAPDVAALLLHKSTSKISIKEKALTCARQQKANYELTLGATLGAALGNSCRVRQGALEHTPCCRGGFVLDDNHRDLGSLSRSLDLGPEREQGSE